jgi:hypothetical protein
LLFEGDRPARSRRLTHRSLGRIISRALCAMHHYHTVRYNQRRLELITVQCRILSSYPGRPESSSQ